LVGKREFLNVGGNDSPGQERSFLVSTTHGAEMSGLGAFIETVTIYKEKEVIEHLWRYGEKLCDGMMQVSRSLGLERSFYMEGAYPSPNYVTRDANGQPSLALRTLFAQEMVAQGVLMPWIALSLAHGEAELDQTLSAVEHSLRVYRQALEQGVERFLRGPAIKPVFRRYN